MAPFREIKTYEKKLKSVSNISTISTTIRKKRFKRLKVKELPPTTQWESRYLTEDSLNIETENTFDKLLKGKIYNEVQIVNTFIKNSTSDSDQSKSCKIKSTPMITRSKSKGARIEINSAEESDIKTQSNSEQESKYDKRTNSEDLSRYNYRQTSLDRPVDISLSVEKVHPNHVTFSSLSYIKIPKLLELKKYDVVSSTPYDINNFESLPNTVSPIKSNCDQQLHQENNLTNITPKLSRRSSRKRHNDLKSNCPPRKVLLDHLLGFNDHESQESLEKSHQFSDFNQTIDDSKDEIQIKSSFKLKRLEDMQPKVVLSPPVRGFNEQDVKISANDSNQFRNNVSLMIGQQISANTLIESAIMSPLVLSYSNINGNNSEKSSNGISSCHQKSQINNSVNTNNNLESSKIVEWKLSKLSNGRQSFNSVPDQKSINNSVNANDSLESSDIVESSIIEDCSDYFKKPRNITVRRKRNEIKPGKLYRRSLTLLQKSKENSDECNSIGGQLQQRRRSTLRNSQIIPLKTTNKYQALLRLSYVQEKEERDTESEGESNESINTLEDSFQQQLCLLRPESVSITVNEDVQQQREHIENCSITQTTTTTAKDIVLRKCQQTEPIPFEECYPNSILNNCHKLGEGVYGEVFLYKKPIGTSSVLKIIPIENDIIVNGERQKTYEEVLSEIIISLELSNLRTHKENQTTTFVQVETINCVYGQYPNKLIDLWHLYDETKGSENDSPEIFPKHQIYIVLELANAGQDIESFVFNNALQALSMFKQVACALAVAEIELKFEHRDLHWGNILIKKVDSRKKIPFIVNQQTIEICSNGIEVTIIDYTLSRAEFNGVVIYNDLSKDDELFKGTGDHQFEIYRLMQNANRNNWQDFQPRSNIFWLRYLLMKMIDGLRYLNIKTKTHRDNIKKIQEIESEILNYDNVVDFVKQKFIKKSKNC